MYLDPLPEEGPLQEKLVAAAAEGDLAAIKALVAQGAKPNVRGLNRVRALSTALEESVRAKKARVAVIAWLVEHGAPLAPVQDRMMSSALYFEALDVVELLKARGVAVAPDGLITACHFGKPSSIRFCLKMGCDPRAIELGYSKRTVLHALADREEKDAAALTSEFLDAGVPLDVQDRHGRTALYVAALRGNVPVVKLLLERGADRTIATPSDDPSKPGKTPEQAAKNATTRKAFATPTAKAPKSKPKPVAQGRLSGAEMKAVYEALQGNLFEGPFVDDAKLGRALAEFANEHYTQHAESADGDAVALETLLRDEEGPETIAAFLAALPPKAYSAAMKALAGALDELESDGSAAALAARLRKG